MKWFRPKKQQTTCPFCLTRIESETKVTVCTNPKCKQQIPILYLDVQDQAPAFFTQVGGWSASGKTVYLNALTLVLRRMPRLWPDFYIQAANEITKGFLDSVNRLEESGEMPQLTQLSVQQAYVMILANIPLWGSRSLVLRDCGGENFNYFTIPVENVPYLIQAPTTLMFISPAEQRNDSQSSDTLMTGYLNTLRENNVDLKRGGRSVVVVLSKADLIRNLPPHLTEYLSGDPLWPLASTKNPPQMNDSSMQRYMAMLQNVSDVVEEWYIGTDVNAAGFVHQARHRGIEVRFTIVSSVGAQVKGNRAVGIQPCRVLDPLLWALHFQSQQVVAKQAR